jgi:uncharacterized protein YggU (UPF0235/DUF167 family)
VVGRHGEAWKVHVNAPPESWKANEALVGLLATTLGIPQSRIEIVAGRASREKTVVVHGLSEAEVEASFVAPVGAR